MKFKKAYITQTNIIDICIFSQLYNAFYESDEVCDRCLDHGAVSLLPAELDYIIRSDAYGSSETASQKECHSSSL